MLRRELNEITLEEPPSTEMPYDEQVDSGVLEIIVDPISLQTLEMHERKPNDDVYRVTRLQPDGSYLTKSYVPLPKAGGGWNLVCIEEQEYRHA